MGGPLGSTSLYRFIDFIDHDGGRFIVTGESGDTVPSRSAKTVRPGKRPTGSSRSNAALYYRGMALRRCTESSRAGRARLLLEGRRWTCGAGEARRCARSGSALGRSRFMLYNGSKRDRERRRCHLAERHHPTRPTFRSGPLRGSPDGTIVAADDGWMVWYEKQKFFRSTDGKTWEVLPRRATSEATHQLHVVRLRRRRSRLPRQVAYRSQREILP